jgi:tetratricopeptide (TPR) repeat protein
VPISDTERLVEIGYDLYDAGQWRELADLPGRDEPDAPHAARLVAQYFAALATRRLEGVSQSRQQLEALAPFRGMLGRYAGSFDVEVAYLREISGDYRYAHERFRELSERTTPFDPTRRDHVRARLYYADMLIIEGRFAPASRMLLEAYEDLGRGSPLLWAELVRHRGHAHRFSFDLDVAETLYLRALDEAGEAPSLNGKLRTNLAETRCWREPHRGVLDAEMAIDLNARLGNRIEVAKAHAARAVALAGLGRTAEAREACDGALRESASAGYPAGACFARQALVVTQVAASAPDEASAAYQELAQGVRALATYGHLCVVPAWLRRDEPEVEAWSSEVDWVQPPRFPDLLGISPR